MAAIIDGSLDRRGAVLGRGSQREGLTGALGKSQTGRVHLDAKLLFVPMLAFFVAFFYLFGGYFVPGSGIFGVFAKIIFAIGTFFVVVNLVVFCCVKMGLFSVPGHGHSHGGAPCHGHG